MVLCVSQFRHVRALCTTCGTSLSQRGQGAWHAGYKGRVGVVNSSTTEELLESWQQRGHIRTNILTSQ